jgi:hypothetical protein
MSSENSSFSIDEKDKGQSMLDAKKSAKKLKNQDSSF